jgi:hypothetical protein
MRVRDRVRCVEGEKPGYPLDAQQIGLRLVSMLLEIFHERRAARSGVIARRSTPLCVDVARGVFQMKRPKVRDRLHSGVVGLGQVPAADPPDKSA